MNAAHPPDAFGAKVDRTLLQSLAREYGRPEPEVEQIFQEELGRITAGARIDTFVTVLATSSVRLRLREQRSVRH